MKPPGWDPVDNSICSRIRICRRIRLHHEDDPSVFEVLPFRRSWSLSLSPTQLKSCTIACDLSPLFVCLLVELTLYLMKERKKGKGNPLFFAWTNTVSASVSRESEVLDKQIWISFDCTSNSRNQIFQVWKRTTSARRSKINTNCATFFFSLLPLLESHPHHCMTSTVASVCRWHIKQQELLYNQNTSLVFFVPLKHSPPSTRARWECVRSHVIFSTPENQILPGSMANCDLLASLLETQKALDLFLNNEFDKAKEMTAPLAATSIYHSLGYSAILYLQASQFEWSICCVVFFSLEWRIIICIKLG